MTTYKKTYIPGKPRNKKLTNVTSGVAGAGKTEFNQVAGESHTHPNKGVLDQITEAMLASASRDMITSTNTETELTDENYLSSLRVLQEILDNNEYLGTQFLSKVNPDTAKEVITFMKGIIAGGTSKFDNIEVGNYTTGPLGAGAAIKMENGVSRMEVDQLDVRMRAVFRELIIESLKHIGGQLILSLARMRCTRVIDGGTYYKCYFDTGDGKVSNEFVAGDQARCQVFTGSGVKMYWRLVTSVGTDWINLSKTDAISGSSIPEAGDDIVQLGNRTDTTRQNAQILSTVGADAPSWKQYKGINSFSLEGKDTTVFSGTGNKIDGKTVFVSSGSNLDDWATGTSQDIQDAQAAANAAALAAQQAIDDAAANVGLINTEVGKLQAQIDGEVSNWFYPYSPTLANYPASDWTTNTIKDRHIGDTFTNTAQAPATDAGKSWRFVKNGTVYSWTQIADSDAVLALQKAAQAQSTADGKSTTYLIQPTSYKLGDMWVLAADQTVNGVAYKSGEILTATQDSTTYNQAHWVKKVRYTDDTAVGNLQIGGRNLLKGTKGRVQTSSYQMKSFYFGDLKPQHGERVTIMFKGELGEGKSYFGIYNSGATLSVVNLFPSDKGADGIFRKSFDWKVGSTANTHVIMYHMPNSVTVESWIEDVMLVIGDKAAYYAEAPEDVQARIDAAKLTAEQAQLAAEGYMRARYIRDWCAGNTTNNWNEWNEIKVFLKNGTNIALGKPVTGGVPSLPSTPYSLITDGNTTNYANTPPQTPPQAGWVRIDLGQIYYDIDYIQVWHYWQDGRTYYGTKTEISEDGVNWTTVFDSAKSGTYKETEAGKIHTLRPNEVLAKVLKGAAVTDTFKTTINGGLISTVITEYRELNSEQVTGLISGIQGANKNLPFLVAGGTYAEGIAGTAKAIIRHDGTVKFTDGEFTGIVNATTINAQSGVIGGFSLSGGSLTGTGYSDTILLSPNLLRFTGVDSSTNTNSTIFIGANTYPASAGGTFVGPQRIEVVRSTSQYYGGIVGTHYDVYGQTAYDNMPHSGNHALWIYRGSITGVRFRTRRATGTFNATAMDTNIIVVANSTTIWLPTGLEDGQMYWINPNGYSNVVVRTQNDIWDNGGNVGRTDPVIGRIWHLYIFDRTNSKFLKSWMSA